MTIRLLTQGRLLLLPLTVRLAALQTRLDDLMLRAEELPEGEEKKKGGLPTWAIVVIIVAVLLCLGAICLIVLVPVILAMLGPSIGNVFSNVIEDIEATPY
jgi:uncharacterized protein YqhQ